LCQNGCCTLLGKGEDNTSYNVTGPELLSADDMVTGGRALRKDLMAVLLDRGPFQGASVFLYCEKVHLKRMAYFIKIRFNF